MELSSVILRFTLTFILALIFGIERQRAHKPTGFATFIFVSVGSCALAITAINLNAENPLPLLSGIVTGIGFLGAGALIKTGDRIFGFTTASTIWLFAIFGLVVGVGEYFIGISVYAATWVVIFIDRYLEKKGIGSYQKKIIISTNKIVSEREIRLLIGATRCRLITTEIDKKENKLHLAYQVEGTREDINKIPNMLFQKDWFDSAKIE